MHRRRIPVPMTRAGLCLLVALTTVGLPRAAAVADAHHDRSGSEVDAVTALRAELADADVSTLTAKAAEIQAMLVSAATAYDQARTDAAAAREVARDKRRQVAEMAATVQDARADLRSSVLSAYTGRIGTGSSPVAAVLLSTSDSTRDALDAALSVDLMMSLSRNQAARRQQVLDRARLLAEEAQRAQQAAHDTVHHARALLRQARQEAVVLAAASEKAIGAADDVARAQQVARDDAAAAQWHSYVRTLRRAGVDAPAADQMATPATLPDGYDALAIGSTPPRAHSRSHPITVDGLASTRWRHSTLTVLPAETIDLLTQAFGELGKPFAIGAAGPDSYDCGGFTQAMWAAQGFRLGPDPAAQLAASTPVHLDAIQVGDLVFTGERRDRLENVGIYVGADLMLAADGPASAVAVVPVSNPVAAARVTLGEPRRSRDGHARRHRRAPADSATVRCGLSTPVSSVARFVSPVAEGDFTFTSRWGDTGPHWATYHTGLDFAAAPGTPVVSVLGGTVVSVDHSPWAGPFYTTIDHGGGLMTTYAHMERSDVAPGDVVEAGQLIGAVGSYGNATGPHLHLEVHVDGGDVDPMPYLLGSASSTGSGWGGLANGMIPSSLLCPVTSAPGHLLRCDAARAIDELAAAYEADLGTPFCVTDSYRDYAAQVALFARKPSLAAVPGTSNHGWALAVDLCGGAESFGTAQHDWLVTNAPRFGWVDPAWARQDGSKPEPWHWEFGQVS